MAYTYNYSLLLTILSGNTELLSENYAENKQAITEVTKQIISIADSTDDEPISLGGIETAKMVLIKSDQVISVTFNETDTLTGKLIFLKGVEVTDLTVSNSSGSTATLLVLLTD